ncbi:hypothetical protein ES703_31226 [subsurface metagenome]
MKRWLSLAAIVVLAMALVIGAACGGGEGEEEGVTELKIGQGLPLTGGYGAAVGLPAKYAYTLAAEKIGEFEVAGEKYRWKPIFEDNFWSPAGGVSSTMKFIHEYNVGFMIQQAGSDPGLAAVSICEEVGKICDVAGASIYSFGPEYPHMFQIGLTSQFAYAPFYHWLTAEHPEVQRVTEVHTEDVIGLALHEANTACCEHYGLEYKGFVCPAGTVEWYHMATKIMASDPDLVVGTSGLFEALWDRGYEGFCISSHWTETAGGEVDWGKAAGSVLITGPHPIPGLWPETDAIREEYEHRFGLELTPAAMWALCNYFIYTDILQQAGTVDDVDRIAETMETGTFDSRLVGPVHYGGEALNGIGHCLLWPSPIYMVVGENEYEVLAIYTPDEVEAIVNEVFK